MLTFCSVVTETQQTSEIFEQKLWNIVTVLSVSREVQTACSYLVKFECWMIRTLSLLMKATHRWRHERCSRAALELHRKQLQGECSKNEYSKGLKHRAGKNNGRLSWNLEIANNLFSRNRTTTYAFKWNHRVWWRGSNCTSKSYITNTGIEYLDKNGNDFKSLVFEELKSIKGLLEIPAMANLLCHNLNMPVIYSTYVDRFQRNRAVQQNIQVRWHVNSGFTNKVLVSHFRAGP